MKVLFLDTVHPILADRLSALCSTCIDASAFSKEKCLEELNSADGIVIRSRFTMNEEFLQFAPHLKFIARSGAGMENIDERYCKKRGIVLFNAPEGNRNAVGEHALGMLLALLNKLHTADRDVRLGKWDREGNRGLELDGKTVGIIGYGNMGKSFAKKLRGFDVEVLCYDIVSNVGDALANQVSLEELQAKADVVSLHTPWTEITNKMINADFIHAFHKPFWFINTARGRR